MLYILLEINPNYDDFILNRLIRVMKFEKKRIYNIMIKCKKKYTIIHLRWLMCIDILYKYLCSLIPYELLIKRKWYVGESIIMDSLNVMRNKYFFYDWVIEAFKDFVLLLCLEEKKYHRNGTLDMKHV